MFFLLFCFSVFLFFLFFCCFCCFCFYVFSRSEFCRVVADVELTFSQIYICFHLFHLFHLFPPVSAKGEPIHAAPGDFAHGHQRHCLLLPVAARHQQGRHEKHGRRRMGVVVLLHVGRVGQRGLVEELFDEKEHPLIRRVHGQFADPR